MGNKSICLLPQVQSLGGPQSFQNSFIDYAKQKGIDVHFDPTEKNISGYIVIGAPKKFLSLLITARMRSVPVILRLNGMNWIHRTAQTSLRYKLKSELNNHAIAFVRRFIAGKIVYQSVFCEDLWNSRFGKTQQAQKIIYNGTDLTHFTPTAGQPDSNEIRILAVEGSYAHGMDFGLDIAVQLIKTIAEKFTHPCILQIAGKMPENVQSRILGQVLPENMKIIFLGICEKTQLAKIEATSTLFISTELNPSCPNSVIEALACGLPVIGFDSGSLKDLVGNGGLIVPYSGNPWKLEKPTLSPLIEAAEQVITQNISFRIAARQQAENRFNIETMVQEYIEFLC